MRKAFYFSAFLLCSVLAANAQYYSFIGNSVNKVNALTNEITGSGLLLIDPMLSETEIIKKEIRYASDAQILNSNGNPVLVERILDMYYPDPEILFLYGGAELDKLPVLVLLHAGHGNRNTIAEEAKAEAMKGYIVIAPSYRSDRSLAKYCIGFENTAYGMVQDVRSAFRLLTKISEDVQTIPISVLGAEHGAEFADFAEGLKESRGDFDNIIFSGYSAGGFAGFHTVLRINQNQFPDYLNSTEPYIVNGNLGPANLAQNGNLDDVGIPYALNHPFQIDKIKGVISRTIGIGYLEDVDLTNHPSPVPLCIIHGTCDRSAPYVTGSIVGSSSIVCDAVVTFPDGSSMDSATLYGPDPVSKAYTNSGGYAELITLCGGGHVSNRCVASIITARWTDFIRRVLVGDFQNGDLLETVYRFLPHNYSDQCCHPEVNYGYLQKCSCDADNPFTVIDLPEVFNSACTLTNCPDLVDYCNLTSTINAASSKQDHMILTTYENDHVLLYSAYRSRSIKIEIFDIQGKLHFTNETFVSSGSNMIPLPTNLPVNAIMVARAGDAMPLKFLLQP